MKTVEIYTDGACSGNPGKGGWAAVLIFNGQEKEISGGCADTTNNRMELSAVIEGLKCLKEQCNVNIYSDSSYVVNAFQLGWISNWIRKGWSKVKNTDLWQQLLELTSMHNVKFFKVKGHSDNIYNNRCDVLARAEYSRTDE